MSARGNTTVYPCPRLAGRVRVPGDKSISHRVAMLGGLADGVTEIEGFLTSGDCMNTLSAVESLGAGVAWEGGRLLITGTRGSYRQPADALDLGNSGTGIRLLTGLLAGHAFSCTMTGDASLNSRPMGRIKAPLEKMGARVGLSGDDGCAPIAVTGGGLKGITYELPVASAQVKSCVLLAGLFARGTTTVIEPKPTRDHTEQLMAAMGASLTVNGLSVSVQNAAGDLPALRAGTWRVPGDVSSAAFWLAAAAAAKGTTLTIEGVGLNPRRTAFLEVLKRMGANVDVRPSAGQGDWEPMGDVTVAGGPLCGTAVDGLEIPNLIDELPLVAVLGCLAQGETVIRDAEELRVKESDRISTMAANLRALGQDVEVTSDGMVVRGGRGIRGGCEVRSHGDHRIAMCMAVLSLFADAPVAVLDTDCIATSYPDFWQHLELLGGRYVQ
jgi:3-phosphoshikimate 1-carboxyvinyltransferase